MHQISFHPGAPPDATYGSYIASSDCLAGFGGLCMTEGEEKGGMEIRFPLLDPK